MHVNYYCDTCGKAYPNEKESMECEKKHAEEARVAKELEEAKTQAKKDIEEAETKLVELKKEYEEKYGSSSSTCKCVDECEASDEIRFGDFLEAIIELLS